MHTRLLWLLVLLVVVATCALFILGTLSLPYQDKNIGIPSVTIDEDKKPPVLIPYGEVTLTVGTTAFFDGLTVTPVEILEDSRCPSDVTCIQAGTVRVLLQVVSGMGTSSQSLALGETMTTEAESILFESVRPEAISTQTILLENYKLTFTVEKRELTEIDPPIVSVPTPIPSPQRCYIGGCSSQICSNVPDMASDCMYREEYACYQTAICEVQETGQCGWTDTATLRSCVANSR